MATTSSSSSAPSPAPEDVSLKLVADTFGFKLVPKDYNCEKCVVLETEKRDLGNQVEALQNQNKNIIRQIVETLNPQQTQNQDDVNDDLLSSVVFQQRVVAQVEQSMIELRCLKELFKTKWSFEAILNGKVPQLPMMTRDPSSTGTASLPPPPAKNPASSTSTFTRGTNPGPNANATGTLNGVIPISTVNAGSPSTSSSSSGSILIEAPTPYNSGPLRQSLRQRGMASHKTLSTVDKMPSTLTDHQTPPRSSARVSAGETTKRKRSSVPQQNEMEQEKEMGRVGDTGNTMKIPVIVKVIGSVGGVGISQRPSITSAVAESHEEKNLNAMEVDVGGDENIGGNQENGDQDERSDISLDDHAQSPLLSMENSEGLDSDQGQQDGIRVPQVVEVPIKLKCVVCGKAYKKGRLLQVHMRQAHPTDERSAVKCARCNYECESLKSFYVHHDMRHNQRSK